MTSPAESFTTEFKVIELVSGMSRRTITEVIALDVAAGLEACLELLASRPGHLRPLLPYRVHLHITVDGDVV